MSHTRDSLEAGVPGRKDGLFENKALLNFRFGLREPKLALLNGRGARGTRRGIGNYLHKAAFTRQTRAGKL